MKHQIDTKVLQEVLNYLASKPYSETAKLIQDIQTNSVPVVSSIPPVVAPVQAGVPKVEAVVDDNIILPAITL